MDKKIQLGASLEQHIAKLIIAILSCLIWNAAAQADTNCPAPRQTWFVEAGASADGDGSKNNPLNSSSQITNCTQVGNNIFVIPSTQALSGEIVLKAHQKLKGLGKNIFSMGVSDLTGKLPRLGLQSGAGIQLSDHVTVQNLIIEEVAAPTSPVGTSLVNGQLSLGGVTLKDIMVTKTESYVGAGAINIDLDGAGALNPITVQQVSIESITDFSSSVPANWFKVGVRVALSPTTGVCANQPALLTLQKINVRNVSNSVGVFQFCENGNELQVNADDVQVSNGIGDHFVVINRGAIDVSINNYHSTNSNSARDAILQSSFSPALVAGTNFGLEYFGFPSAKPSRLKMRNSSISHGIGNGIGILQFALNDVFAPTELTLDFGCVDLDCLERGLEASPGNNSIFNNVAGSGDAIGNDYSSYLNSPLGVSLIFPFPLLVDPDVDENIGSSINLYIDTPSDVQFIGQGNYWGENTNSLGTCVELRTSFGAGGATLSQANAGDFSPSVSWNCSLWNTFTLADLPQQPLTDFGLSYDPN